ncbi:MAG: hypothetical protein ACREQ5_31710, partial [Candidatus Dormibacteria bacterium]
TRTQRRSDMSGPIGAGAIAGTLGSIAMQKVMAEAQGTNTMGRSGPEAYTETLLDQADVTTDHATEKGVADLGHLGFGAAGGVLFSVALTALPIPALVLGPLFGRLVWETMYRGLAPMVGVMPSPEEDEPGRPETMQMAHLVYGGVLGALVPVLRWLL